MGKRKLTDSDFRRVLKDIGNLFLDGYLGHWMVEANPRQSTFEYKNSPIDVARQ
jgi:hypothetical protein